MSQVETQTTLPHLWQSLNEEKIKKTERRSQTPTPHKNEPIHPRSKTPPVCRTPQVILPPRPRVRRHISEFKPILCKICNQTYSTKATYDTHEKSHKHTINQVYDEKIGIDIKRRVIEAKIEAYKMVMKNLQSEIDQFEITLNSF
jgi:transposase-like protein